MAQSTDHDKAIRTGRLTPGMTFSQKALAICARVPRGKVTTYGAIARALDTQAYRAVGLAMNSNPFAPEVPCHRVVGSDGSLVGFGSGLPRKRKLLDAEGIPFKGDRVDLKACFWDPIK